MGTPPSSNQGPGGPNAAAPAAGLSYRDAGVDIDAGNEAVERIKRLVATTRRPEQLSDLGGFAGLMGLPAGMAEPVLVSCTDGVGTKLLVAIAMDRHDTVGIDLVAMNVNDLLVTGAQPLLLLDYIAVGKLVPAQIEALVAGVVEGCRQSGCALRGARPPSCRGCTRPGTTTSLPSPWAWSTARRSSGPRAWVPADVILALRASGLHSNGYSLARRALLEVGGFALHDRLPGGDGESVGEAMLRPTTIYARAFAAIRDLPGAPLHAAAHITGGGLIDNPPRALPQGLAQRLDLEAVPRPR
ncbi:MAG: phosphoribosylformylglycinamidine cyclo-ligase [Nannocystaceae bacterium]